MLSLNWNCVGWNVLRATGLSWQELNCKQKSYQKSSYTSDLSRGSAGLEPNCAPRPAKVTPASKLCKAAILPVANPGLGAPTACSNRAGNFFSPAVTSVRFWHLRSWRQPSWWITQSSPMVLPLRKIPRDNLRPTPSERQSTFDKIKIAALREKGDNCI